MIEKLMGYPRYRQTWKQWRDVTQTWLTKRNTKIIYLRFISRYYQ
jgi:hypothetical protein